MADPQHLEILKQGVEVWNKWREAHVDIQPDLSGVNLRGTDLRKANLYNADLSRANLSSEDLKGANLIEANLRATDLSQSVLSEADLSGADLRGASLHKANLSHASLNGTAFRETNLNRANFQGAFLVRAYFSKVDFGEADFSQANLRGAAFSNANLSGVVLSRADLSRASLEGAILSRVDLSGSFLDDANLHETHLKRANLSEASLQRTNLSGADLSQADLSGANLLEADLQRANLCEANFTGANLSKCRIYAVSAWNVRLKNAVQSSLIITPTKELIITVDNLKIAQFIYLLLNNAEIRDVIDTIGKKAVLILGRFTPERKTILDTLKDALRSMDYLPILFDFDKPGSQDLTETVSTLAHLARFIIVDLSDPSSTPYEVGTIASNHIKPIQTIFHPSDAAKRVFAMFNDLILRYHWVLPPYEYQDQYQLLTSLRDHVIEPSERKATELDRLRAQEILK